MSEFESVSENTTEVADQSFDETGVNDAGTANQQSEEVNEPVETEEPAVQDSETNAAFARMRREAEQARADAQAAQRELEQLRSQAEAREEAISSLTGGGEISLIADATGMSEDEVEERLGFAAEMAEKDATIAQLTQEKQDFQMQSMMAEDLKKIQTIDPSIRTLTDLGEDFPAYIGSGLSAEQAYWAVKGKEVANTPKPAPVAGAVKAGSNEKDYFTDAEIEAMSPEQTRKNWKKIMASWGRNG